MIDSIADMLTRIRNSQMVHKPVVMIPHSKVKRSIADILVKEGFVSSVEDVEEKGRKKLKITLKYVENQPVIQELKRISSPGRRIYVGAKRLPHVYDNLGLAIISTSQGLMTNKEARKKKVGGEVICEIF